MAMSPFEILTKTDKNVFLTGPAGTGKTYTIKQFIEDCISKKLAVCLCASTGIAALNIGGETAHKMFHIPVPCFENPSFAKNKKGAITPAILKSIALVDILIIDEISMLTAPAFNFMMKVLHKAEKIKGSKIRVVVVGDLNQLPPVVTKNDEKLLKKFGYDKSGYCFTTKEWENCHFKVAELTEVKRQDNREFIDNLNKIRTGSVTKAIVEYFNGFVSEIPEGFDDSEYIYVCGTNAKAAQINEAYLAGLPGEYKVLKADKTGHVTPGYVEESIVLKEGCRIIFTTNDSKGQYKNGSFGVLEAIIPPDPNGEDDFHREGSCLVRVGDKKVWVQKHTYEANSYSCKGNSLVKKTVGTISQYPFKVGKAITIHKSQGQTFDKCIISPEIFAAGQLYVALSRVRTPEGLILLSKITAGDIQADETVKKFVKAGYKWKSPTTTKSATAKKKTTAKKAASVKKSAATKKKAATKKAATKTVKKPGATKKTASVKKKTVAKKPATKIATKKAPAKKAVSKKQAAKKSTVTKKTPAKKVASKSKRKK